MGIAGVGFAGGGAEPGTIGVAFVDDVEMTAFHHDYLGKNTTTDVLSFASDGDEEDDYRGDIIVCTDQAARQAHALRLPYLAEVVVLCLHGVLHLQGFDHTADDGTMTRLEEALRPIALRKAFGC
ncbi:MAG: rRNA maturation RNase YbeY [Acidobacteria bacterium]|nr:rRNA maturation RNase YbeY [Acidobacteriota bacterium]